MSWGKVQLRRMFRSVDNGAWGDAAAAGEPAWPCIRAADFDYARLRANLATAPLRHYDTTTAQRLQLCRGDLVLEKSGGGANAPVGRAVLYDSDEPALPTNFAARIRLAETMEPRFATYLLAHLYAIGETEKCINQTTGIQNLDTGAWLGCLAPLPPVEEQRRIAEFLDDQVGRIDSSIRHCGDLAELGTSSYSTAVIELTSFGLDGQPRAETGLPWKPVAVDAWPVRPMRSMVRYVKQPVGDRWDEFLLLSLTKEGIIPRDTESNFGKFPESFETYQEVEAGDLVMCLFDVDETPRTVGLAAMDGMVTGAYTRFVWSDAEVSRHFIEYSLIGIDDQKAFRPLYTGMRKGIQTGRFLSAQIPVPPRAEQERIVSALDERSEHLASYLRMSARRTDLLEERKRSLITAAVTGEMDVTTAAPISMGRWVPGPGAEVPPPAPTAAPSLGGI